MKRLILTLSLALMCAPAMWGACAATGSGNLNWSSSATWAGCIGSVPSASDATTIGTGIAVTCDQAACDVLTLTTAGTGSLTVASGNTFTAHSVTPPLIVLAGTGGVHCQPGSTCTANSTTTTSNTANVTAGAGTYFWIENGGVGTNAILNFDGSITGASGSSAIRLDGTINCNTNSGAYQKIQIQSGGINTSYIEGVGISSNHAKWTGTPDGAGGGLCYVTTGGGNGGGLITNYADIKYFGNPTNPFQISVVPAGCCELSIQNTWFDHTTLGTFKTDGNADMIWKNVAVTNEVQPASHLYLVLQSNNMTPSSGQRIMQNVGFWAPTPINGSDGLSIGVYGMKIGASKICGDSSDIPGVFALNIPLRIVGANSGDTSAGTLVRNSMGVKFNSSGFVDTTVSFFNADQLNSANFCNTVAYGHIDNDHYWNLSNAARSGNQTVVDYYIADGDGFVALTDEGDVCQSNLNTSTCTHGLVINRAGNLATLVAPPSTGLTYKYNTGYHVSAVAVGENSNTATSLAEFTGNLMVAPVLYLGSPTCTVNNGGILERNSFVSQSNPPWGYNVGYAMPNSGDVGAIDCNISGTAGQFLTSVALGATTYVDVPATARNSMTSVTSDVSGNSPTHVQCTACNFSAADATQVGDYVVKLSGTPFPFGRITAVIDANNLTMDAVSGFTNSTAFSVRKGYRVDGLAYGVGTFGSTDFRANPQWRYPTWTICNWYNSVPGTTPLTCANSATDLVEITQIARDMFCSFTGQTYDGSGPCVPITGLTVANMFEAAKWSFTPMNGAFAHAGNPADTDAVTGGVPSPGWVPAYPAAILSN